MGDKWVFSAEAQKRKNGQIDEKFNAHGDPPIQSHMKSIPIRID
jgi:hypothetical protein